MEFNTIDLSRTLNCWQIMLVPDPVRMTTITEIDLPASGPGGGEGEHLYCTVFL